MFILFVQTLLITSFNQEYMLFCSTDNYFNYDMVFLWYSWCYYDYINRIITHTQTRVYNDNELSQMPQVVSVC